MCFKKYFVNFHACGARIQVNCKATAIFYCNQPSSLLQGGRNATTFQKPQGENNIKGNNRRHDN